MNNTVDYKLTTALSAAEYRALQFRRIDALVKLRDAYILDWALQYIARSINHLYVFEAVADQKITPEEGTWLMTLNSSNHHWLYRFLSWFLYHISVKQNS